MIDRESALNALNMAITAHRRARISLAAVPMTADRSVRMIAISRLKQARCNERRARVMYAPFARIDRAARYEAKIQAKIQAIRDKRYWRQIQSRSRTTEPARVQRAEREQRRQQAHQAATAKRMANRSISASK